MVWKKIKHLCKLWTYRHQETFTPLRCLKMALKGLITILIMALFNEEFGFPLLLAPFGASCILVFTYSEREFAQPINIIGGYLVTGFVSIVLLSLLPAEFWAEGIAIGASIFLMALLRVTHPPAGGIPIVLFLEQEHLHFWYLFSPIFCGSLTIVLIAYFFHSLSPGIDYPRRYPIIVEEGEKKI